MLTIFDAISTQQTKFDKIKGALTEIKSKFFTKLLHIVIKPPIHFQKCIFYLYLNEEQSKLGELEPQKRLRIKNVYMEQGIFGMNQCVSIMTWTSIVLFTDFDLSKCRS